MGLRPKLRPGFVIPLVADDMCMLRRFLDEVLTEAGAFDVMPESDIPVELAVVDSAD